MEGGSANPWEYGEAAWKATVPLGHSVMGTYGKPGENQGCSALRRMRT